VLGTRWLLLNFAEYTVLGAAICYNRLMSNGLIALFFGAGVGGWAYSQLARRTGNANPSSTFMAAGFVGLVAAIFIFILAKTLLHN